MAKLCVISNICANRGDWYLFVLTILKSVVGNFPGNWEIKLLVTSVSV